jgi:hypothetical protein
VAVDRLSLTVMPGEFFGYRPERCRQDDHDRMVVVS